MKGSGMGEIMKRWFNNMKTKASGLWTDGAMFSSNPAYQPVAPAYQPVAPAYPPVAPAYPPVTPAPYPPVAAPYQPVALAPPQQFVGGMPAYNSYYDKSIDHSQRVHGYETAKPLTYVSGYGGGRRGRKRRGGDPCTTADLPYSTMETGSSYANNLTGGKRRKNSRKTRKYRR
jgi:hypothetical protein